MGAIKLGMDEVSIRSLSYLAGQFQLHNPVKSAIITAVLNCLYTNGSKDFGLQRNYFPTEIFVGLILFIFTVFIFTCTFLEKNNNVLNTSEKGMD